MMALALWRGVAGFRSGWAQRWKWQRNTTNRRLDKSTCHKRCKPLKRLAFCRAWRSVAGMNPGFCEGFQGFRMHRPGLPLSGGSL